MKKMKWVIILGDGFLISGLLIIFRNVVEMVIKNNMIIYEIFVDLGFLWWLDKVNFFFYGNLELYYFIWMKVSFIY